jgi:hypothetical protein
MSDNADPARHADAVSRALYDAGLVRQADAFAKASGLAKADIDGDFAPFDAAFGSAADLQAAIRSYIDRTPSLVEWARQARAKIGDEDRLSYLTDQLHAMDDATIDRLPKPLKEIFVVDSFNAEMLNGGVHQYFFNSSGKYAPDAVLALRDLGLNGLADAVQRGIDMFSKPYPTDTARRRQLHFGKDWSEWDERLSSLTDEVDDGTMTPALISLAKRENLLPK